MISIISTLTLEEKKACQSIVYEKNQCIAMEGDACFYLAIVEEGEVHIFNPSQPSNDGVFRILLKGDCFGHALLFSSHPYFLGTVVAQKRTTLTLIPKKTLLDLLQSNLFFLSAYLNLLAEETKQNRQMMYIVLQPSIEKKVMAFLLQQPQHSWQGSLTSLSQRLQIPRPSLSRVISRMYNEKQIYRKKKIIYLGAVYTEVK